MASRTLSLDAVEAYGVGYRPVRAGAYTPANLGGGDGNISLPSQAGKIPKKCKLLKGRLKFQHKESA
jgi:hypothetical protein